MRPPVWVVELAEYFWQNVTPPPFPRDLDVVAGLRLPLRIVRLPGLEVAVVIDWLRQREVTLPLVQANRPLRACLMARAGAGFVFLDRDDTADERRFSLAHEIAHYLHDYDAPRRVAQRRLGPAALEVFDGQRSATTDEQLHSLLRDAPVSAHVHLLGRDSMGRPASPSERDAEDAADRLAYELLAPAELFPGANDVWQVSERLVGEFGFPMRPAEKYAALLAPLEPPEDKFLSRLRKLF